MPSPFPGMDPYLEDTLIWPGFHHSLAEEVKAHINAQVGPKYYADVSVRTVVETISITAGHTMYPDVGVFEPAQPVTEPATGSATTAVVIPPAPVRRAVVVPGQTRLRAVHVYLTGTDQLVTSIEILSPFNKRRGEGMEEYRMKRARLLRSSVHLVELDLLRGGQRPGDEVNNPPLQTDYILLVNRYREDDQRISEIWPVALNEPLPVLPIPLLPPDPDVGLDLTATLLAVYTRAGYAWRIDYQRPVPPPALRHEMAVWLKQHLVLKGLRGEMSND